MGVLKKKIDFLRELTFLIQTYPRRKPKIGKTAKETLTVNQRKDYNYREKNREKILAYQREYYKKKQAKKLNDGAGAR